MNDRIYTALTIFGIIGLLIIWSLDHAYIK
jgi:hypothetical protein